jgi:hypothetical protein
MSWTQFTTNPLWETAVSLDEVRALRNRNVVQIAFWRQALNLLWYHHAAAVRVAQERAQAAHDRGDWFAYYEWERTARLLSELTTQIPKGGL